MIVFNFLKNNSIAVVFFYLVIVSINMMGMQSQPLNQLGGVSGKVRVGAGIITYYYDATTGQPHVVLGLERRKNPTWDYFGGRQDNTDRDALHTAARETHEEAYRLISVDEASNLHGYVIPSNRYVLFVAQIDINRFSPDLLFQSYVHNLKTKHEHTEKIDFIAVSLTDLVDNMTQNGVLPGQYVGASGNNYNGLDLRGGLIGFINRARQKGSDQQRIFQAIIDNQPNPNPLGKDPKKSSKRKSINPVEHPKKKELPQQHQFNSEFDFNQTLFIVGMSGFCAYLMYKVWNAIRPAKTLANFQKNLHQKKA